MTTTAVRTHRPSQNERVLTLLRTRGRAGLTTLDLLPPNVIDNGEPILRLTSRVNSLRHLGYDIRRDWVRTRKGARIVKYTLVGSTPATTTTTPAPQPEQIAMLGAGEYGHRPMCAIDDTEVE